MLNLFEKCAGCLLEADPRRKCEQTQGLYAAWVNGGVERSAILLPELRVGRPERPLLVPPGELAFRGMGSHQARLALLHAIAHIEFTAINLALDVVCRFQDMPEAFHLGWLQVAAEESNHFTLVCDHMTSVYQCAYGDFNAHDGLWEMAVRTAHDPLARMAMIPRLFEARGLDATPAIIKKFKGFGDKKAVAILELILEEEVGHVALGDFWFKKLCQERGLEPEQTFKELLAYYDAPPPRRPFNEKARRAAGFSETELAAFE